MQQSKETVPETPQVNVREADPTKSEPPSGAQSDASNQEEHSKCDSTDTHLRRARHANEDCPRGSTKENTCCTVTRDSIQKRLKRPVSVRGVLNSVGREDRPKVKDLLVRGDHSLSFEAELNSKFWESLAKQHKTIANGIRYAKRCDVPSGFLKDVYVKGDTDSMHCLVSYIVASISNSTSNGEIVTFMESLEQIIVAAKETMKPIMKIEGMVTHDKWKYRMVYCGLHGIIPHQCDRRYTVFLCIGLVMNRTLHANRENVSFPFKLSEPAMKLLLRNSRYFPSLHLNNNNPLALINNTDTHAFENLSAAGNLYISPTNSIAIGLDLTGTKVLRLRNCGIRGVEFDLILKKLEERESSMIEVLDLGNNPIRASKYSFQRTLVSHMLVLDSCQVDTNMANLCLSICAGQLDLSENERIVWKSMLEKLGVHDRNMFNDIHVTQLVATGCHLQLSNKFSKLKKLCCDRVVHAPIANMQNLTALCLVFESDTYMASTLQPYILAEHEGKIRMEDLAERLEGGSLTELIFGGSTPDKQTFGSKLNKSDSEQLSNALTTGTCKLEVLGLSYCQVTNIENVIMSTLHLNHLQELYIAKLPDTKEIRTIAQALRVLLSSSNTLKVLGINDNPFDESCIADILHGLNKNRSLMELHMNEVPMHPTMLTFDGNNGHHPLRVLELSDVNVTSWAQSGLGFGNTGSIDDARFYPFLMESLTKFTKLRTLKCRRLVARNNFKVDLMKQALMGLRSLTMLQHLDLSECYLDHKCLIAVMEALSNSAVQRLTLDGNNSGELAVYDSIVKCLQSPHSKIRVLGIKNVFTKRVPLMVTDIQKNLVSMFPSVSIIM